MIPITDLRSDTVTKPSAGMLQGIYGRVFAIYIIANRRAGHGL